MHFRTVAEDHLCTPYIVHMGLSFATPTPNSSAKAPHTHKKNHLQRAVRYGEVEELPLHNYSLPKIIEYTAKEMGFNWKNTIWCKGNV
jgi:hypothetical protein